jgi:hypothetical protein
VNSCNLVTQTKNGIAISPLTIDKYFAKKNTNIRSKTLKPNA